MCPLSSRRIFVWVKSAVKAKKQAMNIVATGWIYEMRGEQHVCNSNVFSGLWQKTKKGPGSHVLDLELEFDSAKLGATMIYLLI